MVAHVVQHALDPLCHNSGGALRVRAVDESAERHFAVVHAALDVCRVDETVRSQPIVQLLADAIVGSLVVAGATPRKRPGNPPRFRTEPLPPAITCLAVPAAVSLAAELLASAREASRAVVA
jgi:hypothetical protein